MSNSPLISYIKISPNRTSPRNHVIDTISIHCVAGNCSIEVIGDIFEPIERKASSNYGIGTDGRIGMYCEEEDRSWCTSSSSNDHRAITIEVANDGDSSTGWHVSDKALNSLIVLCVDICKRNNINELLWEADKSLIGQIEKQNMTVHRWFADKTCPGEYLYNKHGYIAYEVNKMLNFEESEGELDMTKEELMSVAGTGDKPSGWAKEATEKMKELGIFNGDGQGNYGWQQPITREAVATILANFMEKMNL